MRLEIPVKGLTDSNGHNLTIPCYKRLINGNYIYLIKLVDIKRRLSLGTVSDKKLTDIVSSSSVYTVNPRDLNETGKPCRFVDESALFRIMCYYSASHHKILGGYNNYLYESVNNSVFS